MNKLTDILAVSREAFPEAFAKEPHPEIRRTNCRDVVYLVSEETTPMMEQPSEIAYTAPLNQKQCELRRWVSKALNVDCRLGYAREINVVFYYI
jgi:hypothetical protein